MWCVCVCLHVDVCVCACVCVCMLVLVCIMENRKVLMHVHLVCTRDHVVVDNMNTSFKEHITITPHSIRPTSPSP